MNLLAKMPTTALPISLLKRQAPWPWSRGAGAKRGTSDCPAAAAGRFYTGDSCPFQWRRKPQRTAESIRNSGGKAEVFIADLTSDAQTTQLMDAVVEKLGRIDVLVNSAAMWRPVALENVTADEVRKNFELNTLATFLLCKSAGLKMAAQKSGGAIVNIGDWAITRPYLNYSGYFPSKGAIPTLTRNFAIELSARNPRVRVNAVLPGPVMLPPDLPAADRAHAIAGTLVKREGTPEHVADAVHFLICNDFVTGVCLPVDGGRTICSQE
ncbi:MAG: SDR family oxidoreductase [Pirellulales bacterium]